MNLSIRWKLIAPIVVTGIVICGMAHALIVRSTARQVEKLSSHDAKTLSSYVAHLRSCYTSNVVADAARAQVRVSHDHTGPDVIPLPPTMVHGLNARMHSEAGHASVRLFSPYPFAWRKDGGLRDALDREDWDALSKDPKRVLVRTVTENGEPVLRYATADVMGVQACVDCHNSHASSPRTGWKLGDTRGLLPVSVPMGSSLAGAREEALRATQWVVLMMMLLIASVLYLARRFLFVPLEKVQGAAKLIASGQLDVQLDYRSRDEVGEVADSFREMAQHLRSTVLEIREVSERVAQGSRQLSAAADPSDGALGAGDQRCEPGAEHRRARGHRRHSKVGSRGAAERCGLRATVCHLERLRAASGEPAILDRLLPSRATLARHRCAARAGSVTTSRESHRHMLGRGQVLCSCVSVLEVSQTSRGRYKHTQSCGRSDLSSCGIASAM